jgi:hypothetical protein
LSLTREAGGREHHAGRKRNQRLKAATIQRHILDKIAVNNGTDRRVGRIDIGLITDNRNGRLHGP